MSLRFTPPAGAVWAPLLRASLRRLVVPLLAPLAPLAMAAMTLTTALPLKPAVAAPRAAAQYKPDPDVLLIDVYRDMAANRLRDALAKSDALVRAYPNFQLGQLIRGDLLLMQTHTITGFGKAAGAPKDKLDDLREEAIARLKSLRERPDPSLVPRAIVRLRDDQKNVLVVDAKRSRLYMYENHDGELKLVNDYYVSQGKYGVDKFKEGDGKTPLGVYYITGRLSGARLPEFYGAGALPISYPNEWDKLQGRSGSGIWLHGTPPANYSRAPLASDGCVVLTNQDLHQLYDQVEVLKTPVIISNGVEFVTRAKSAEDRKLAAAMLDAWQRDLATNEPAPLRTHYSVRFKSEQGDGLDAWLTRQLHPAGAPLTSLAMRDISFFYYPGKDDVIVATFTQDAKTGRSTASIRKRQYWVREGGSWKIISESSWSAVAGLKTPALAVDAVPVGKVARLKNIAYQGAAVQGRPADARRHSSKAP